MHKMIHRPVPLWILYIVVIAFFVADLAFYSMAQEIKDTTPIVREYKVAVVGNMVEPAPIANTVQPPVVEQTIQTMPIAPVKQVEPMPVTNSAPMPTTGGESLPVANPITTDVNQQPTTSTPQMPIINEKSATSTETQVMPIVEEEMEIEVVDPREVKNALNDIKRLKSELARYIKQLKKLPNSANDIVFCNDLTNKLTEHYNAIKMPKEDESLRANLQDFWDGRYWDEINVIRAKVELPREVKAMSTELKKAQKLLKQKAFQKLGFDMEAMKAKLDEIQVALTEVQTAQRAGDLEAAMESLQGIQSDTHPGDITSLLYQMKEVKDRTKAVRNKEVKEIINDILQEVIDTADGSDFREANMALNDARAELLKLASKYMKGQGVLDDNMRAKFDQLEAKMQEKMGGGMKEEVKPDKNE